MKTESLSYKEVEGRKLMMGITKPADWKASDRRAAMVFFHGGGWVGGSLGQFQPQSEYLASRGMVCFNVEYRLLPTSSDTAPTVCCMDAKSAMRWVRGHAAELGVDPDRIGAGGGSAGGHLAAFVGMVEGTDDPQDDANVSPKANAMVLFNPVLDNGPDGGWGTGRVGKFVKTYSPAHNITSDAPPAIVMLGRQDKLIPVATIERFQKNMKAAGVRCDVVLYDGQGHGFFNHEPYRTRTLMEADRFLASLGWLEGPPTLSEPADAAPEPDATEAGSK